MNRAIGGRLGDFEKRFSASQAKALEGFSAKFEETFGGFARTFEEKLAALKPAEPPPKGKDKGEPEAPKFKIEDDPGYKELQKKLEGLTKSQAEIQQREAEAQKRTRDLTLRSRVTEALQAAGVTELSRAKMATGLLIDSMRIVGFDPDADDSIVFATKDGKEDLAAGVKTWLKTEEGKMFLPPRGSNGSGGSGGSGGSNGNTQNPLGVAVRKYLDSQ